MITLYTLLQLILFPFLFLPTVAIVLLVPRYRMRTLYRLGLGLKAHELRKTKKRIWIHALSVGEVTSALPLISGLRKEMPEVELVFSAATRSGSGVARKLLQGKVDHIIPFPFDFLPVVKRFLQMVKPDLFILIETDFWPSMLSTLKKKNIPSLLVNGRISEKSMTSYKRFSFFFLPLFSSFRTLSMQTEKDRGNLIALGIDHNQVKTLGNLKYDTALYSSAKRKQSLSFTLPPYNYLLVAGSTHDGEEEILLQSFKELKEKHPQSYMVIAPRQVARGKEIQGIAASLDLQANCRSQINAGGKDILILDTIGELNTIYSHADIAFVGGSLVAKGGHNPIEPSIFAVPVLFGPHMEDFSEISKQLLLAGGAFTVADGNELSATFIQILNEKELRLEAGKAAQECIKSQQGVIKRHINLIKEML